MCNFLDLFAGAGGLSEGFVQAGFFPIAHVESNKAACNTLRTRSAYQWLRGKGELSIYNDYLNRSISRAELYSKVPSACLDSVINIEISDASVSEIVAKVDSSLAGRKLDLIIGGPPCQSYSLMGRSTDKNRMIGDKRNYLYIQYAKFLQRYQPKYFVFENVPGLLSAKDTSGNLYLDNMRSVFRNAGYQTELMMLSAEQYGVPQSRKRIIIVGRLGSDKEYYPEPSKWNPAITVNEVFRDLPSIQAGGGEEGPIDTSSVASAYLDDAHVRNVGIPITWHKARPNTDQDLEIYRCAVNLWDAKHERLDYNTLPDYLKTHCNRETFLDRFKVVAGDLPYSHTVVAHIAKDGHYYIHPDIDQNRSISVREAARLQTFPDDFYFEGTTTYLGRTPAFRQIGNAVPVHLAKRIADKLQETW